MINTRSRLAGILTGLAVAIAGCTNNSPQANTSNTGNTPANVGEVNLYSSRHYDSDQQLYDNFTEETGIEVNLIEGDAEELIERIKNEGENSPADVLITVDVGNLWRSQQEGILQPIESETLTSAIPENIRSSENYWFGLTKRARIIVYNQNQVKPEELSTYEALAEPEWQDRVCVRSSNNIYNQSLVASKIEEKGVAEAETWAKGLVENFAREPEGNDTDQIKAVASGECDLAIVNHYYVARLKQAEDSQSQEIIKNIGVFFPNQNAGGTHVNISGAGVAANAPNQENAVKFIEYLTTPEAQEIFANQNNEFPAISSLQPNEAVASFGKFKESGLKVSGYGEKNSDAVQLMDRAGWK